MSRAGLLSRLRGRLARERHRLRLWLSMRHIHGPRDLNLKPEDVTVVALVRNGEYYLDTFFAYYRALGARHFVFIDNGSDDGTVARIMREADTSIVRSDLPWGLFENDFRGYAARTYCAGHWCLFADMDEQFDFEGRETVGLSGLVRYLAGGGYTALVAQMLEMFPKVALRETADLPFDQAVTQYQYYDPGHVRAVAYHDPDIAFSYYLQSNVMTTPAIEFLSGGVRRKIFGEDCALTKHPLVFVGEGVQPGVHPHCAAGVTCADFTALIRHYKFTNNPFGRDAQTVQQASISHGEDRQRLDIAGNDPELTLYSTEAQAFGSLSDLQEGGFLVASPQFTAFVQEAAGD